MAVSKVVGVRETALAIRRMSDVQRPVSESSRYALQPVLKTAKANLRTYKPHRYIPGPNVVTGDLMRSMAIRQKKRTRAEQQTAVTATGKGIRKAHLVEFGTDPHWQPRLGVMHPGAKPFPFLTPAYDRHDQEAVKRFGERIGPALEAQAVRVAAKVKR